MNARRMIRTAIMTVYKAISGVTEGKELVIRDPKTGREEKVIVVGLVPEKTKRETSAKQN